MAIVELPRSNRPSLSSGSPSRTNSVDSEPNFDGISILKAVIRKRWWLLLLLAVVSGGIAYFAAKQLGSETATVKGTLIYSGIRGPLDKGSYEALALGTCKEMLVSPNVLEKLKEARGLGMPTEALARSISANINNNSTLMHVELTWANADHGVEMVNQLFEFYIEAIADHRKKTLKEDIQNVELSLLRAKSNVAEARQRITQLNKQREDKLSGAGLNNERYRSTLDKVSSTQLSIDEKITEQTGMQLQIKALEAAQKSDTQRLNALISDAKKAIASEMKTHLDSVAAKRFKPDSEETKNISDISQKFIDSALNEEDSSNDLNAWVSKAFSDLQSLEKELRFKLDLPLLSQICEPLISSASTPIAKTKESLNRSDAQIRQMELSMIPLTNQIAAMEVRKAAYEKEAREVGDNLTGITSDEFGSYELRLEEAEEVQKNLSLQLTSLTELEQNRGREWQVSLPASLETTVVKSNRKKLFVFTFGLTGLVLSIPVFLTEWHKQRLLPQVAFAKSLQLPVLADRILADFSPNTRGQLATAHLSVEQLEVLRMLALRIQQSCHRPGSVILFSSIESQGTAAHLMTAVAECLAEREERVLIVDAICPRKNGLPITNVLPISAPKPASNLISGSETQALAVYPGLAEYLTEECEAVGDLVRPTGCPGVDIISSGNSEFPREAMASSCLTELVENCRQNYTMILVNSPAATATADLQMLTARADGIVLTASKSVSRDPKAKAAIVDLMELGAPIIGVVA